MGINQPQENADAVPEPVTQNIEAVAKFYEDAAQKISRSQRMVERLSQFIGQPLYLGCILLFIAGWIIADGLAGFLGYGEFDVAPFFLLQGMITLAALLTTTIVLIKQNREEKLEEHRSHLELQINLLAEQKITKIISLLEELRHDLPSVRNRTDDEAKAMERPTDPNAVLGALSEVLGVEEKHGDPK